MPEVYFKEITAGLLLSHGPLTEPQPVPGGVRGPGLAPVSKPSPPCPKSCTVAGQVGTK